MVVPTSKNSAITKLVEYLQVNTGLGNIDMSELIDVNIRTYCRIRSNSFRGDLTTDQRLRIFYLCKTIKKIKAEKDLRTWLFQKSNTIDFNGKTNLQAIKEYGVVAIFIISSLEKLRNSDI